jgi:hypothetical protein
MRDSNSIKTPTKDILQLRRKTNNLESNALATAKASREHHKKKTNPIIDSNDISKMEKKPLVLKMCEQNCNMSLSVNDEDPNYNVVPLEIGFKQGQSRIISVPLEIGFKKGQSRIISDQQR